MKKVNICLLIIMLLMCGIAFNRIEKESKRVILVGKAVGVSSVDEINAHENIGIMTYLDDSNSRFVLLCHGLYNKNKLSDIKVANCYEIENLDIEKSTKATIGSLNAKLDTSNEIGFINENTSKGLYGNALNVGKYTNKNSYYEIASKFDVKKGNAEIYLDLFNDGLKAYNVEIERIDYFNYSHNIYLKITDPELLEITGGMVKGISGAPVVQNGKLVGAINYGTEEDTTRGCAIFADKL